MSFVTSWAAWRAMLVSVKVRLVMMFLVVSEAGKRLLCLRGVLVAVESLSADNTEGNLRLIYLAIYLS